MAFPDLFLAVVVVLCCGLILPSLLVVEGAGLGSWRCDSCGCCLLPYYLSVVTVVIAVTMLL